MVEDREIHIFPFFSEESHKINDSLDLNSETLVLRGQVLEKRCIDDSLAVCYNNKKFEGDILYWHPIAKKDDIIQKGIQLIKTGLKPNQKNKIIENLFTNNKRSPCSKKIKK